MAISLYPARSRRRRKIDGLPGQTQGSRDHLRSPGQRNFKACNQSAATSWSSNIGLPPAERRKTAGYLRHTAICEDPAVVFEIGDWIATRCIGITRRICEPRSGCYVACNLDPWPYHFDPRLV